LLGDGLKHVSAATGTLETSDYWERCFLRGPCHGPHQQTRNCLTVIKIWSWALDGCLAPRQTDRLSVGRNIILNLELRDSEQSWLGVATMTYLVVRWYQASNDVSTRGRGNYIVGSLYQATTGEDEDSVCCCTDLKDV
jgi:hypothetical protein